VSGNYFSMFGVTAIADGRSLQDDQRTPRPWRHELSLMAGRSMRPTGGDRQRFPLNDKPFTVVGITPRGSSAIR